MDDLGGNKVIAVVGEAGKGEAVAALLKTDVMMQCRGMEP